MKINSKQSSKRKFIIIILVIVFVVLATGAIAYSVLRSSSSGSGSSSTPINSSESTDNKVNLDPPTQEQKDAAGDQKKQSLDKPTSQNTTSTLPVIITAANQNKDSSTLQIRTLIENVTSTGSCTLTLIKDGQTISKSSSIQAGPNNSTCQGFDVALSELSLGTWSIRVDVASGQQSGTASSEVTINAS